MTLPTIDIGIAGYVVLGNGHEGPLGLPFMLCVIGNLQSMVATAIVVGLRRPAAWALVLLTKIGPGVGLAWFLFRREWRNLGVLGMTTIIAGPSFVVAPGAWADLVRFALANYSTPAPQSIVGIPLSVRVLMSLALLAWGSPSSRTWVVPIAAGWEA